MESLESDYRSGKISAEKYSYFRSKYEDKLNSIDAKAATRRIRSMQGKASSDTSKKKRRKPTKNRKKEEQDLVQKYIINPKKSDANYNKKKKSSIDSGTFKLLLLLILVIGFTAGTAYGIFNFDFGNISGADAVAVVDDTAFPEIKEVINTTKTSNFTYDNSSYGSQDSANDVEVTTDDSYSDNSQGYDNGGSNQQQDYSPSQSQSDNSQGGGGSNQEGGNGN